jgi:hypothetical protein
MNTVGGSYFESPFPSVTQRAPARRGAASALIIGIFLIPASTSTRQDATGPDPYLIPWTSTTGLGPVLPFSEAPAAVSEPLIGSAVVRKLHDDSGLTWEQLGRLFGVSRRAVHLWANGGRMNSTNAETLSELVIIVSALPASSPEARRTALLASGPDGHSIFDGFRARRLFDSGRVTETTLTPDQLLGARHDDVSSAT